MGMQSKSYLSEQGGIGPRGFEAFRAFVFDRVDEAADGYGFHLNGWERSQQRLKCGAIFIGGVFNYESGYTIISKTGGIITGPFFRPKLLMRQGERDSSKYDYLKLVRESIKPIHEDQ